MPPRSGLGERISSLEATIAAADRYAHERWHKLDNDLQPLALLPAQIARDLGKLEGRLKGEIVSAVEKLESRVDALEAAQQRQAGALGLLQNPIVAGIVGAIITWAMLLFAWWKGAPK